MRKRWCVLGIVLLVIITGIVWWDNHLTYEIDQRVSDIEENSPLDIDFKLSADRRGGKLQIVNNGEDYIVFDLSKIPIRFEVKNDDGWHRIISHKIWHEAPEVISQHNEYGVNVGYGLEFKWREVLGGKLEPGKYRAIFYYGDGEVKEYEFFNKICEFEVE